MMRFLPETLDLDGAEEDVGTSYVCGQDPAHSALERITFDTLDLPCFLVRDDWFDLNGKRKPGVWFCYQSAAAAGKPVTPTAIRICSPLYVAAVTHTEDGRYFGRLLRFLDTLGRWRQWAMPMELLRGSGEELRGELLAAGVEIEQRHRAKLADYLQWRVPDKVIIAALRTGWTTNGRTFVLPERILGDQDVYLQSDAIHQAASLRCGGEFLQWQQLATLCIGNSVLMASICVALAGPLLNKVHQESGGIHWIGDTSTGKTTALVLAASVWGGEDFKRSWRATSNGMESVAVMLSDTCLCLDEINEADPQEIGAIVYCLGNGTGKTRANKIGAARQVQRWRLSILSTGERSISAAMQENGKQAKAGHLMRLLNIPVARRFGVFDELHQFGDGRALSDHFRTQCARHFGHAGVRFVEYLIQQGDADFAGVLSQLETQFPCPDNQTARAASKFALYAMAGELAIEGGILPWPLGSALAACQAMYQQWLLARGSGLTEHRQILQNVTDYLLKHGDSKFTDKMNPQEKPRADRSGWYVDRAGERIYLFTSAALREAGGNFDFNRVLDALETAQWIVEHDQGKRSKKTAISGVGKLNLYWLQPNADEDHA
jgi:putative DNA primase/helicase